MSQWSGRLKDAVTWDEEVETFFVKCLALRGTGKWGTCWSKEQMSTDTGRHAIDWLAKFLNKILQSIHIFFLLTVYKGRICGSATLLKPYCLQEGIHFWNLNSKDSITSLNKITCFQYAIQENQADKMQF